MSTWSSSKIKMASFIRFGANRALNKNLIKTISTSTLRSLSSCSQIRCINTSSKPPQASTNTTGSTTVSPIETGARKESSDDKSENWISWGANEEDQWWDRFVIHSTFFFSVSLCLVGIGAFYVYLPDPKEYEWIQREAYLQLRYREDNGLPLIDRNLVDPSKITLPTDEELGDTEIII